MAAWSIRMIGDFTEESETMAPFQVTKGQLRHSSRLASPTRIGRVNF